MVAVLPYLIHRNPNVWPNPAGFDPARFTARPATISSRDPARGSSREPT
jgi:cytochrome P450